MPAPSFERSEDHLILHALLARAEPGELINYAEMSAATGHVISGASGVLRSVLNRFLNEDGIVFANVRLIGYQRLTPEQTVEEADANRGRLHQHARRTSRRLITVDADFHRLDQPHRVAYAVGLSLFQAMMAATTKQTARRLEEAVKRTDLRPLPFHETLAAFQK